jgi:hypothetical protein
MEQGYILNIDPITKIKTIVYTQMEIRINKINFGENSSEINVRVFDDSGENYKIFNYLISGVDYLEWTTDNYIINWVKNKLRSENF